MNKKEELVITKDNYKGYSELYRKRVFPPKDISEQGMKFILLTVGGGFITIFSAVILAILNSVVLIEILACCYGIYGVGVLGYYTKCINDNRKKENQELKAKYPYIDCNISTLELEESLEKAKNITKDDNYIEFNVKQYEDYNLKANQIKQDYFNETKYDKYIVNPPIEEAELNKVRQKVKKLGTR